MRGSRIVAVLVLGAVLVGGVLVARRWSRPEPPRIVLLGLDGADWDILRPLLEQGKLPNLARLCDQGSSGSLRTLADLPLSPVIWTSIATGQVPEKHGITWFLVDTPEGRVPVRSRNRRVPALWNLLAESGRAAGVVGFWATAPAEDVGPGVIVSDALGYHGFGRCDQGLPPEEMTHPSELLAAVRPLLPPLQQIDHAFAARFFHLDAEEYYARSYTPARAPAPDPQNPLHLFQEYASTTLGYTAISESLLRAHDFDLFLVYYESTDSLAHLFMKYAPPRLPWVSEEDFGRYRDVVDRWYELIDEQIGRVLASAPGCSVVVVSDHGFRIGAERPRSDTTVDLRGAHLDHDPDGILVASGPLFRAGQEVQGATVLDVAPTLLYALGLPVPRDMDGRVLTELFPEEVLGQRPVEYAEPLPWTPAVPAPATVPPAEAELAEAALQQLQALGYVDGPGATPPEDPATASSPEQHNNLGRLHLAAGKLDPALGEFRAALDGTPNDAEAWNNIALVQRMQGRNDLALQSLTSALTANPNHTGALQSLAALKTQAGDLATAESLLRQVLVLDDRMPEPHTSLGDVLQRQGREEEAAACFARAVELDPRSTTALYDLGVVRMNQGQLEEARALYERVLELEPRHALALNNLGHVLLLEDQRAAALETFRRAAEADPRHVESRFNLGSLLLDGGDAAGALPWLEQAVALNAGLEPAQLLLGKALLLLGEEVRARQRFEMVVRMFPHSSGACVELARLALRQGNAAEIEAWLRHAVQRGGGGTREALARDPDFAGVDLQELLGESGSH